MVVDKLTIQHVFGLLNHIYHCCLQFRSTLLNALCHIILCLIKMIKKQWMEGIYQHLVFYFKHEFVQL